MKYGNEGMDLKKLLLFLIRKFWIVVLAAAAGAFLGGAVYLFVHVVINSNREYQAQSKVYLDFAYDETGEVYQQYNGYTWNDLMSTNLILDTTMSYLPKDYTEEEVIEATSAEILSDLRLLTVTITTYDPERTGQILQATDKSLAELGQREKEFTDIEIIKETEPEMLVADPRLAQAVLIGFIVALVLVLTVMLLVYILDDGIYVPGDLKCVTEIPFIGFSFEQEVIKKASGRCAEIISGLNEDFEKNKAYLMKKSGDPVIIELKKGSDITEQMFDKIKEDDVLLLSVTYGRIDRATLDYRLEQFRLRDLSVSGIIIKDADMRFIKWYYNHL